MNSTTKLIIIGLLLLCPMAGAFAQIEAGSFGYYNEALLFSQTRTGAGSARMQGIGGAQTALGADISSAYTNPAGLGLYNRSEVSFTPGLSYNTSNTDFFGTATEDTDLRFNVANFGVVINNSKKDGGLWKGGSWGITFTRTNDFNSRFRYEGENFDNSIIDFFLEQSNGLPISQLSGLTGTAFDHYLINPAGNDIYDSFILGFPIQEETVETRGSQNQLSISYGGNVGDKFYFGLGVGLTTLRYRQDKTYREFDYFDPDFPNDPVILNDMVIREDLDIDGTGFNATFGFIFRPTDVVRFGMSLQTPTFYNLDETYSYDFETNYNNFFLAAEDTLLSSILTQSDLFVSEYELSTPLRINTGVAFFLGKSGFISGDVEFVNYRNANLQSVDFDVDADNRTINNLYQPTINLRLGGEYRVGNFRLRAGYAHFGDPFDIEDGIDRSSNTISAGFGVKFPNYYFDLGVNHSSLNSTYSPYTTIATASPLVNVDRNVTNAVFTLGFTF